MKKVLLLALIPASIALAVSLLLLIIFSSDPLETVSSFFLIPFSSAFFFGNMLDQASLILLCALGFLLCMRIGIFNLGGEGQAYFGALVASQVALALPALPIGTGILVGCLIVMVSVGCVGVVSALFKEWFGISELISSFLLSSATLPLIDFLLGGPLRNQSSNLLASYPIPSSYDLSKLLLPSSLNIGIYIALVCTVLVLFFLYKTRFGYEMRVIGDSREFSKNQGIRVSRYIFVSLGISAAFQGLAGALSVYGTHHAAFIGITSGIGWNGIAAALIGRNHPLGAIIGALIFAWFSTASQAAMIHSSLNFELSAIVQGMVLLLVTIQVRSKKQVL